MRRQVPPQPPVMMNDEAANARLRVFLDELPEYTFQFQDCETVDVHTRGCTGDTPLKIATVREDVATVTDLLNAGADPNNQGEDDETSLHHAVAGGNLEIIRLLLAHGASPHIKSDFNQTPLEKARLHRKEAVIRLLEGGG